MIISLLLLQVWVLLNGIEGKSHRHSEVALSSDGCQEYNYRYPSDCDPASPSECSFLVKWTAVHSNEGNLTSNQSQAWNDVESAQWVEYQVTAAVPDSMSASSKRLWLALGFSGNQEMVCV